MSRVVIERSKIVLAGLWLLICTALLPDYLRADELKDEMSPVLINQPLSQLDKRYDYPRQLLALVLEKTAFRYGDIELQVAPKAMLRDRALLELERGELLQVMAEAPKPEWEQRLIAVRIPIRKGLQGYRLFLIRAQDQPMFTAITEFTQLAAIPTGSGAQWSTRLAMEQAGMTVVSGQDYESLFRMLMHGRFLSFGRGINEIFDEYVEHKRFYPDLAIEQSLALYIPLPTYFFVSPKYPQLAERIELGLRIMIADGSFDTLFLKYHSEAIANAALSSRRIFSISNPNLSAETPLDDASLWFKP